MLFPLPKARGPVVTRATTILGDEDIFVIEQVAIWSLMGEFVNDTGFEIYQ